MKVFDMDLAIFLIAQGYELLDIRDGQFVFPEHAQLSADAFYENAAIPARRLLYAAKQFRERFASVAA